MIDVPIQLLRPHDYQREILQDRTRFRVVACGRQFGKTELSKYECAIRLLQGQYIWFCSPTNKNSKRVFRQFYQIFKHVPDVDINRTDQRVELPTGGVIEFISLHEYDNLRGEGLNFAVVDEAAFVQDGVFDQIIRPMLLKSKGHALFISSPNGLNWFHDIYTRGLSGLSPEWSSYHYTSYDNPHIDDSEIDSVRTFVPERVFKQEYLGEFIEDGGAIFRFVRDAVGETTRSHRHSRIVFGVDLGRVNDFTVITAIDVDNHNVVEIDRFTDTMWDVQEVRLRAMVERWQPETVIIEENFNDSFVESMQKSGLPVIAYRTTARNKAKLINDLAMAFEQHDITIPHDEALIGELQAFTVERLPAGGLRYAAPQGKHDDMVISLALAWHGITQGAVEWLVL